MGRSGEGDDDVDLAGVMRGAVSGNDLDLRPGREIVLGAFGQVAVMLDRGHASFGADHLRQDRSVVAGAGTDLQHALAMLDVQLIEQSGPQAGLAVVEAAHRIDDDQNIMVEAARIVVVGEVGVVGPDRRQYAPGPGAEEALAGNHRKGIDDGLVAPDRRGRPQLLREPAARVRQGRVPPHGAILPLSSWLSSKRKTISGFTFSSLGFLSS